MQRKQALATNHIYHIFNRSIAGYTIFPSSRHYSRFMEMLLYYQLDKLKNKFSQVIIKPSFRETVQELQKVKNRRVDILAYCLMPNHFHLILKQNDTNGISDFMRNVQNSYSHFFNMRHNRQGPLWAGKFKNILCESDEQLLHLSRYIHLNPVTAHLVNSPDEWVATSHHEYISSENISAPICHFKKHIDITPSSYHSFVIKHIDEQRQLAQIKHLLFD